MSTTIREVKHVLDNLAPPELAEPWDNVGLQLGDPDANVECIAVALDVTTEVIEEALTQGVQLLISHHPLIFKPVTSLTTGTFVGRAAVRLLSAGCGVLVAHTNLDNAPKGLGRFLCDRLGLTDLRPPAVPSLNTYKLAVFTPTEALDAVREAMARAGAGIIGNYSHCSFELRGTGTYVPLEGASPYAGQIGRLERAEEVRLEMVVPEHHLASVLRAMEEAHPYEEVAYDVYRLHTKTQPASAMWAGSLPKPVSCRVFSEEVCARLEVAAVRLAGAGDKIVRRVAVVAGSGASAIADAFRSGAEVLVTGDLKHHDFLAAREAGLAVIDAGHAGTEKWAVPLLCGYLNECLQGRIRALAVAGEVPFVEVRSPSEP